MKSDFECWLEIIGLSVTTMVGLLTLAFGIMTMAKVWDTNAKITDVQNMLNIEYGE